MMFSAFKVAATLFALAQLASAQVPPAAPAPQCPSITNPVDGTAWKLGDKGVINWIPGGNAQKVTIKLRKGLASAMQEVAVINPSIDNNAKTFTWNVPANLPPGSDYALEIGNAPNLCYSHFFTIDANGKPLPGNAATGTAGTNTALLPGAKPTTGVNGLPSAAGPSSAANSTAATGGLFPSASGSGFPPLGPSASGSAKPSASVTTSSATTLRAGASLLVIVILACLL
ncbi:uncharacterized protein VTP21DRAFT_5620 [Calcarisporiella thermophila]|uniref:uncharacterized protein n=1 Tax=Calcarisporiella thermophila TaxID=911321 RepID=UPI003742668E